MSVDGIMTRAIVHESQALLSGRITKIYQPAKTEVTWIVRSRGRNICLLLSAHPVYARMQTITKNWDNPPEPPMFCRILRKHIEGGIIERISQVGMERVIHIDIRCKNEWGDWSNKRLVVELMGRHSNLILINPDTGQVYDAIRRVPLNISSYRQVLPNSQYLAPPDQGKLDPFTVDQTVFLAGFDYNGGRLDQQLVHRFTGISPLVAREIIHLTGIGKRERLWTAFRQVIEPLQDHHYQPTLITQESGKQCFAAVPLTHLKGDIERFSSINQLLDAYYLGRAERDRTRQQAGDLLRKIKNEIEKNNKKIRTFERATEQIAQAETWRMYGELTIANLYQIERGMTEVSVLNYFDAASPLITLPLDPRLTPTDNAQRFFKRYQKLRDAQKWNREQLAKAYVEVHYLESVLVELAQASLHELEQIREELYEEGYLKRQANKTKRPQREKPLPLSLQASDGTLIWIGKNNKQNDYLTHRLASAEHTWLHTKDIPGSHVVIQTAQPSEQTLREAAILAAYHSKAQSSSQVPVDYTLVKHVKKPNGARPGYVIYSNQQTLYVTPSEEVVRGLLK